MTKTESFNNAAKTASFKAATGKVAVNLKAALQASLNKIDPSKSI